MIKELSDKRRLCAVPLLASTQKLRRKRLERLGEVLVRCFGLILSNRERAVLYKKSKLFVLPHRPLSPSLSPIGKERCYIKNPNFLFYHINFIFLFTTSEENEHNHVFRQARAVPGWPSPQGEG